jgi:D-sedoheptulose 7-phosphate isomerase
MGAFLKDLKNREMIKRAGRLLIEAREQNKKVILVGNGGSAAIAEHTAADFTKGAKLRAISFSATPSLTAFSNDYGYEMVFSKAVERFGDEGDILIAISSSGSSENILKACEDARKRKMQVITFSGFGRDNPLGGCGDINFWVDSRSYGYVELIHNILLHFINDMIIGKIEYPNR